jgi:hypothetical protein
LEICEGPKGEGFILTAIGWRCALAEGLVGFGVGKDGMDDLEAYRSWPLRRDVELRSVSITNVSEAHWESGTSCLFTAG